MTASTPLLVTFAVYLLAMVAIGFMAWRATRSFDDYILGGRSLGSYVTALSAGASDMSGWLLLGLPGALYARGLSEAWIALGLVLGAYANWRFVAGPLRLYTERTDNALTLPDYFTTRFAEGGRLLRIVAAVVILVFFAVYAASGIVAGARLFESVFGLPYAQALWWGAAATILYTLVGGFLAVSWTDTVQATLMLFALILAPIMVMVSTGGFGASVAIIEQVDPTRLDWFAGGTLGAIGIISLLAWGLGYFGQPHILARFMAADSVRTIPTARRIGMAWMILCLLGSMAVGFFGIAYFGANPGEGAVVRDNPERVFIALSEALFNPWIAGVLLSAILAAIMSTLSCQLLVCASVMTEDFYPRLSAQGREPARTGVVRPCLGAGGCAGGDLDRARPGKPRARPGVLRVGGLRRRVRSGRGVLAVLGAHDADGCVRRHCGRRAHGRAVAADRQRAVRDGAGRGIRVDRGGGGQPAGPPATGAHRGDPSRRPRRVAHHGLLDAAPRGSRTTFRDRPDGPDGVGQDGARP